MLIIASTLFYGQGQPIHTHETAPEHVHTHCSALHTACESLLLVAYDRGRLSSPDETQGKLCLLKPYPVFSEKTSTQAGQLGYWKLRLHFKRTNGLLGHLLS